MTVVEIANEKALTATHNLNFLPLSFGHVAVLEGGRTNSFFKLLGNANEILRGGIQ